VRDQLIRGTAMNGKVRVFAVNTTRVVEEIRSRLDTWPTATAALGRAVSAGAMMGAMLKGEEKLTIQVKGNGPLGQIVVDANAKGEVRGFVSNPHVDLPSNAQGKFDVAGAVGTEGTIYVIKDLGLKEPYRGSVPIISGELGDDFTYYFVKSEQTPSAVALGVLIEKDATVRSSGGFIIQLLPGLSDEEVSQLEERLAGVQSVSGLFEEGLSLKEILEKIVDDVVIFEQINIVFRCGCSPDRVEQTLISLGKDEIQKILEEDEKAEIVCHFCNEKYQSGREDLKNILNKISSNPIDN
jgi:molecular chaperone Hsp33